MSTNLMNTVRIIKNQIFYFIELNLIIIGNAIVIEGENNWTNSDDPNSGTTTESHHHKEQIIIENPNDPMSSVTHRLEDVHVTVENETTTPVIHEHG
jgi:hypothetical protein